MTTSLEKFVFMIFVIATLLTTLMAVCTLSGIYNFKTYDHWLAPMTFAITLTMWEMIIR